ncbi:MAG: recombinase family protein [Lachnospiraceae bacterium]|nr:recombinase family protein [Lachnospiraceae bacterium]
MKEKIENKEYQGQDIQKSNRTVAYIRVSSKTQNEARQVAALRNSGICLDAVYTDRQSGKDFNRPAWQEMLEVLRPGDLVVTGSIDRLGRNYEEILEQWRILTKEKQVDIRILDMPLLDTRASRDLTGTLISDIVLQLLSYVAESERKSIRRRQAEGIAAAKARGVQFGREEIRLPDDFSEWFARWRRKEITGKELSEHMGVHITTVYRRARKMGLSFNMEESDAFTVAADVII